MYTATLLYVGRPYCSFLQNTLKYNLILSGTHVMIARNENASSPARLEICLNGQAPFIRVKLPNMEFPQMIYFQALGKVNNYYTCEHTFRGRVETDHIPEEGISQPLSPNDSEVD